MRRYTNRSGISVNVEQQLVPNVGFFARAGVASGDIEPYEFPTLIVAAGLSVSGKQWGRPHDTFGIAGIVNSITGPHSGYLNAGGGLGILIGDGKLLNAGAEKIMEVYFSLPVGFSKLALGYQFIANPAYNRDRGPVSVVGARLRMQL